MVVVVWLAFHGNALVPELQIMRQHIALGGRLQPHIRLFVKLGSQIRHHARLLSQLAAMLTA